MKTIANLLVGFGFLGGALLAVMEVDHVVWPAYIGVLLVGVVGLFLHHRERQAQSGDQHQVAGNLAELGDALARIRDGLETLCNRPEKLPPHEVRFEIDRVFRGDLNRFADAREAMKHAWGLQAYADIMSAFAAGERYLNRVWTASADGYVDEVLAYLEKARVQFGEALHAFEARRQQFTESPPAQKN